MSMKYLILTLMAFSFFACSDEVADLTVEEYIAANNLTTKALDKGVHIVIDRPGNDTKPNINSSVVVNYIGRLTDGTEFESKSNQEFQFSRLIEGWRIGLKELGEGGSCTLIIPPSVGYGGESSSTIPANSVLVFETDLIEVK